MRSIRDVAVFAWAVVGINGNLANYGHGLPGTGAQPFQGGPIWDPVAGTTPYQDAENPARRRGSQETDGTSALLGPSFGYDASCVVHRPSVQRYNSAPTLGTFRHEGHPHISQSSG